MVREVVRSGPSILGAIYDLECTDCSFRTSVCGDLADAMASAEAHRSERSADGTDHFVNLHRRD